MANLSDYPCGNKNDWQSSHPEDIVLEPEPQAWQRVWRALLPQFSRKGLESLLAALQRDDPRLICGSTTNPPALGPMENEALEGCDIVLWAKLDGKPPWSITVGMADEIWAEMAWEADKACGYAPAIAALANWWDSTPRDEARVAMITEVTANLIGLPPDEPATSPLAKQLAASIDQVRRESQSA